MIHDTIPSIPINTKINILCLSKKYKFSEKKKPLKSYITYRERM